jgi:hypothetical protein
VRSICLALISFSIGFSICASEEKPQPAQPPTPAQSSKPAEASKPVKAPEPDGTKWEHYSVIVEKNIFAKAHGGPGSSGSTPDPKAVAAAEADAEYVLVGIVQRDGKLSAFVENRKNGTTQIVRTGEAMGSGKAGALTLDSVEYVNGTATTVISIGKTLTGGDPPKAADIPKPADAPKTDAQPGPKTAEAPSNVNDILERMRKKRQEEMRK